MCEFVSACVLYTQFLNREITLEHSAAILSHARQVIAEFPIMFTLKSHSLVWLYIQPYREPCKGIYLASFQTTATKHVLKKMIQNIKKAVIYFRKTVHVRQ